jgi:hypothetical protein
MIPTSIIINILERGLHTIIVEYYGHQVTLVDYNKHEDEIIGYREEGMHADDLVMIHPTYRSTLHLIQIK